MILRRELKNMVFIIGLLCAITLVCVAWKKVATIHNQKDLLQDHIAEKVIRFHVRANSDADIDQAVKKQVRDAVGAYMSEKFEDVTDIEQTRMIIEENMPNIIQIANMTLQENGFSYRATASLRNVDFPEKTYGSYTFPEGEYEALEIVLGEGEGENWWCVLYPNMCFNDCVYEVVEEDAKESLREVLTPAEYADVFEFEDYEIRWKLLEYFD